MKWSIRSLWTYLITKHGKAACYDNIWTRKPKRLPVRIAGSGFCCNQMTPPNSKLQTFMSCWMFVPLFVAYVDHTQAFFEPSAINMGSCDHATL